MVNNVYVSLLVQKLWHFFILTLFLEYFQGSRGGGGPPKEKKIGIYQVNLLEHISEPFYILNHSEPLQLDNAYCYRGKTSQKQRCARARARALQNQFFFLYSLYGSYLGYHNLRLVSIAKNQVYWRPLIYSVLVTSMISVSLESAQFDDKVLKRQSQK